MRNNTNWCLKIKTLLYVLSYMSLGPYPAFQCCTLKIIRAWYAYIVICVMPLHVTWGELEITL